ncbi:hypothetical protein [Rhodoferax antarcticus]|uniref:hypothetical protein n=1 Tax=Rhodoferax antarcticus TaxID=81479 RepID=UPI0022257445|nr:hypothetical protein [Rhodoferax antarcticus]MCW2314333.1 hypothetical protein [Rhodoferax antarcticus]
MGLEVAVVQAVDHLGQGCGHLRAWGHGAKSVVVGAAFLDLAQPGQALRAQRLQVLAHAGPHRQRVRLRVSGFLEDAEKADRGDEPHGRASLLLFWGGGCLLGLKPLLCHDDAASPALISPTAAKRGF